MHDDKKKSVNNYIFYTSIHAASASRGFHVIVHRTWRHYTFIVIVLISISFFI